MPVYGHFRAAVLGPFFRTGLAGGTPRDWPIPSPPSAAVGGGGRGGGAIDSVNHPTRCKHRAYYRLRRKGP